MITGRFDHKIQTISPGPISPARWLTTAIRILLLYLTTEDPWSIKHLGLMTNFIIKSYAPSYFEIKKEPLCQNGSKHFFNLVKRTRYLDGAAKTIIDDVLRRNSFWGHPENVLIAMLSDPQHRDQAIDHISRVRKTIAQFRSTESDDEEEDDEATMLIQSMMTRQQDEPIDPEFDKDDLTNSNCNFVISIS